MPEQLASRDAGKLQVWRGGCGTFVPSQGAVFQHSIEGKAPGQRGRQGTRPNEGTALMTMTPDLSSMLAGNPDQVPDRIKAQGAVGRLGQPEELIRVGCLLATGRSACITGRIRAASEELGT